MLMTFTNRLNLNTSQEALLSSDVFYYAQCYRKGLSAMCRALRNARPLKLYDYLSRFELTSHQVKSIQTEIEQDIANARANLEYSKKTLVIAIDKRERALVDKRKTIAKKTKSKHNYLNSTEGQIALQWVKGKEQALSLKKAKLAEVIRRLDSQDYSITVGSKALLRKRTSREGVSPSFDVSAWRKDWSEQREYFRYSVGAARCPYGNAEIQYVPSTSIVRIRLTDHLANERLAQLPAKAPRLPAKFIEVSVTEFKSLSKFADKYKVSTLDLLAGIPVTARIYRKEGVFYISISADIDVANLIPARQSAVSNILGLDYNANGIAWAVLKPDGNPLSGAHGFVRMPEMTDHAVSNCLTRLIASSSKYGITRVAIENLDFFEKKAHMRSGASSTQGRRYNKMLSSLAYANYANHVQRKCAKEVLTVSLINPTYSSVAGYARYGFKHNTSADIGASVMIGRQALFGETYRKRGDMPHVVRHKLYKEIVSVLLPNQLTNQRKSQDSGATGELSSWRKANSTFGPRHEWRANLNRWLGVTEARGLTARLSKGHTPIRSAQLAA